MMSEDHKNGAMGNRSHMTEFSSATRSYRCMLHCCHKEMAGNKSLNLQKCLHADQTCMFGIQLKSCFCGAAGKSGSHRHEGGVEDLSSSQRRLACKPDLINPASSPQNHPDLFDSQFQWRLCKQSPPQGLSEKCFPYRQDSITGDPIMGSL